MPELPEVETVRRGLSPHLLGKGITKLEVRRPNLRWEIPVQALQTGLLNRPIKTVGRRGKYLLLGVKGGWALLHLGMSGHLRLASEGGPVRKHDHVTFHLSDGEGVLHFNDTRRFGALLWIAGPDPEVHPLLADLGPEPFSAAFSGAYLYKRSRGRRLAVKNFLMDGRVAVGAGNIYASEALFRAGIHPSLAAGKVSLKRYKHLATMARRVLEQALEQGGTTLRDFRNSEEKPGYFQHALKVYGREGEACYQCGSTIESLRIGQRSSFYCPVCQTKRT